MTDEMLDQLEALASGVVLRTADTEVAVVPMLVAEVRRLREENRSLTRKAAETAAACGAYQDRLAILRQAPRPVIAAMIAASDDWVSEAEAAAMIRAAIRAAEREVDA